LLSVLGDLDDKLSKSYTVRTKDELSTLLDNEDFASASKMQLVEVIMDKMDAPRGLQIQSELSIKTNAYAATVD
jgi:pyruvate decarboxylase